MFHFPEKVQEDDVLQLMKNQFGYCLRGKHESLGASSAHAGRSVQIHFTSGLKSDINDSEIVIARNLSIKEYLRKFFSIEKALENEVVANVANVEQEGRSALFRKSANFL